MDTLIFPPEAGSFGFDDFAAHKRKQIDGPLGIYAPDVPGQSRVVKCGWTLTLAEYLIFFTFYKAKSNALETFLVSLPVESSTFVDYKATFRQDSFSIDEQSGSMIKVSIELEIIKA